MDSLESFVVRIWLEYGQAGEPIWRGHIRHVQDDREAYFKDLQEMREFLEEVSGVCGPATDRVQPGGSDLRSPRRRK
ncbi:MAG: hypothetical protein ACE5H7_15835 [Acidiferrobacterales bacterium]